MPDLSDNYVVLVDPEQHQSNSKNMQLSLKDFLEQKQVDHNNMNRSKTTLLPGSTTEDLCSEINNVMARRGRGDRSRQASKSRSRSGKRLPPPTPSTRSPPQRSYMDPEMSVPVTSSSTDTTSNTMNASSTTGGRTRLRDYSQSGASSTRRGHASGDKRLPRRVKSYDDSRPGGSAFPIRGKMGPIAKMMESQTARMNQSMSSGMNHSSSALNHSSRRFGQQERRHSKSFSHGMTITSSMDGNDDDDDDDEYDEDIQEQMESVRRPRGGRRLPPRSKTADGSAPRTGGLRSTMAATSGRASRSRTPDRQTSGNSFVTGSRIRRITPGSASSGLTLSNNSGLHNSLRNISAASSRSRSSKSPAKSRERSGSPNTRPKHAAFGRSNTTSGIRRTRSSD